MAKVTVNLSDWKQVQRAMDGYVKKGYKRAAKIAAEQVGVTFDDFVKEKLPPPVRKLKVAKHWTAKQRGWWWATMAAKADGRSTALPGWTAKWRKVRGKKTLVLSGGYKRTGLMIRSLDFAVTQSDVITLVNYGTAAQHAKWVIDLDNQSKYHAGNWPTLQALAIQATPLLRKTFSDVLFKETRKSLKG